MYTLSLFLVQEAAAVWIKCFHYNRCFIREASEIRHDSIQLSACLTGTSQHYLFTRHQTGALQYCSHSMSVLFMTDWNTDEMKAMLLTASPRLPLTFLIVWPAHRRLQAVQHQMLKHLAVITAGFLKAEELVEKTNQIVDQGRFKGCKIV